MYRSPLYRDLRLGMQDIGRNGQREPPVENGMGIRRIRLLALLLTHTGQYKVHPTGIKYHLLLDGGGSGMGRISSAGWRGWKGAQNEGSGLSCPSSVLLLTVGISNLSRLRF